MCGVIGIKLHLRVPKNIMGQYVTGSDAPNLLLKVKLVSVKLVARPTHLKHVNFLVDADCAIASDP